MPMQATAADAGRLVVARFLDGTLLKGTINDFTPNKSEYHIYEGGNERQQASSVPADSMKALFFVKSYEGDRTHRPAPSFRGAASQGGRRMCVRFLDGEEIIGSTMGYNPQRQGFFLIPADPDDNNVRIYVFNKAVDKVEWL